MYRFQVCYSKRFQSGILRGRLYHDHLRFVDWKTANDFVQLCSNDHIFHSCTDDGTYTVEDAALFAIEPMQV